MELKFSGTVCRGNSLIVKDVMAEGSVPSVGGKVRVQNLYYVLQREA